MILSLIASLILSQDPLGQAIPVQIYDEGVRQGRVVGLDCRGSGVTCLRDGGYAFITVTSSGSSGGYDGGKVGQAFAADASVYSQIAEVAYSADASYQTIQFATNPTDCSGGQYATGIASNGNLTCATVTVGKVGQAFMADASIVSQTAYSADASYLAVQFVTDPSDCTAGQYATAIAANGNLTCSTPGSSSTRTVYASNGSDTPIAINVTDPGSALISKTVTIANNDTITIEAYADFLNNSGAVATYTLRCRIGSTTVISVSDSTTLAASATARGSYRFQCVYAVRSSSSTRLWATIDRAPSSAANTPQTAATRIAWNTSASNFTGSQTFAMNISSSTVTATQQAIVTSYEITHQASSP